MITACLLIDLTHRECSRVRFEREHDDLDCDRHLMCRLDELPDGARAVVDVGDRTYLSEHVVDWLHRNDDRLVIEVQGRRSEVVADLVRRARVGAAWGMSA